jgi:hypothetical protein
MAEGDMNVKRKIWSEDMTTFNRLFATAIVSGTLPLGSSMSIAAAHHGNPSEHSTTKGRTLSEIEMRERQITAELNRKQLMPQIAAAETAAAMPLQQPAIEAAPMQEQPAMPDAASASQPDDQAAAAPLDQGDVAAIEEDETEATN